MRRTIWFTLAFLATTPALEAAPLVGQAIMVEEEIYSFDPISFSPLYVDVWHVSVTNPNAIDADSVSVRFEGDWFQSYYATDDYATSTDLPMIGPHRVGATFIVLDGDESGVSEDLDWSGYGYLQSAIPLSVDAGETKVVAVLSVYSGVTMDLAGFSGQAVLAGASAQPIVFVPEPTSAIFVGVAFALGFLSDRHLPAMHRRG